MVLNSTGVAQAALGPGIGSINMSAPAGVAFDGGGNIYVVDSGYNRIQKFNSSGDFVEMFAGSATGAAGSGVGQFNYPCE